MENQAVILATPHEPAGLLLVVGQPLSQETRLTDRMPATQTDPTQILLDDNVLLLIQQLWTKIRALHQHVETLFTGLGKRSFQKNATFLRSFAFFICMRFLLFLLVLQHCYFFVYKGNWWHDECYMIVKGLKRHLKMTGHCRYKLFQGFLVM